MISAYSAVQAPIQRMVPWLDSYIRHSFRSIKRTWEKNEKKGTHEVSRRLSSEDTESRTRTTHTCRRNPPQQIPDCNHLHCIACNGIDRSMRLSTSTSTGSERSLTRSAVRHPPDTSCGTSPIPRWETPNRSALGGTRALIGRWWRWWLGMGLTEASDQYCCEGTVYLLKIQNKSVPPMTAGGAGGEPSRAARATCPDLRART